jgi:hypothetical protein
VKNLQVEIFKIDIFNSLKKFIVEKLLGKKFIVEVQDDKVQVEKFQVEKFQI